MATRSGQVAIQAGGSAEAFTLCLDDVTSTDEYSECGTCKGLAHTLCKVGGVMLHVLPFVNYLNHGFFSFNPILFHDLAAANSYAG